MAYTDAELGVTTGTTFVSVPGGAPSQAMGPTAPGATGPGSNLNVHHAAMLLIFGSLVGLVVIGYVFRRGPID